MYRSFLARPFDVILLRFTSLNIPLNVMFDTKQEAKVEAKKAWLLHDIFLWFIDDSLVSIAFFDGYERT